MASRASVNPSVESTIISPSSKYSRLDVEGFFHHAEHGAGDGKLFDV